MVKFIQHLIEQPNQPGHFTIKLEPDPEFPLLGDHPVWSFHHEDLTIEDLGSLPLFLSYADPRDAIAQLDEAYSHGGGWLPVSGFKRLPFTVPGYEDKLSLSIQYPGDPPLHPLAVTALRGQYIAFYPHAWVGVFNEDETFQIARLN